MAPPGQEPQADDQPELRLRVPAEARYGELARLAVAGIAARNGCSPAAIDALVEQFDPTFASLIGEDDGDVQVTAAVGAESVAFVVARHPARASLPVELVAQR